MVLTAHSLKVEDPWLPPCMLSRSWNNLTQAVAPFIDAAKVFYVEGYFLTHSADSVPELSRNPGSSSSAPRLPSFLASSVFSFSKGPPLCRTSCPRRCRSRGLSWHEWPSRWGSRPTTKIQSHPRSRVVSCTPPSSWTEPTFHEDGLPAFLVSHP